MSIYLKRYDGMIITPKDDRILFDAVFDDYGMLYGGSAVMSAANKIHLGGARGFIKGSEVIIEEDDIAVELSDSGTKPGRLKIVVDYQDTSRPVKFVSEVADSFPPLEQDDDINHINGKYEVVYATYKATETVISDVQLVMPTMQTVKEKLVALNTDIEKNSGDIKWIFDQSKQLTDFSAINIPLDESGGAYILVVNTTLGAIGVYIVSKYHQTHQYSTVTLQGQSNISIDSNKSSLTVNVDGTVYFTAYLSRIGK